MTHLDDRRLVVLGGAGFLGSRLGECLLANEAALGIEARAAAAG